MITLHHLEKSQSIRILWLLEELGVPYEVKLYDRDPVTRLAPAEYKAISPLGTAPVITDGDVTMAETNAIVDYILDRYDDARLRPAINTVEREPYLFWFHTSQGSLQPLLTNLFVMKAMTEIPGGLYGAAWIIAYFSAGLMMLNAIRACLRRDVFTEQTTGARTA